MSKPRAFLSWLAGHFERFVKLKRASGMVYGSQRKLLLAFDRYVAEQAPQPPLCRETLIRYLATLERLTPRARDNVICVIWPALAYARHREAPIEELPPRPPKTSSRYWRLRPPRILAATETGGILAAARLLAPSDTLRPATMATLFGLLAATGLRIGEALALDLGDLDRRHQILSVRKGKFGKSRELPLRESSVEALTRYVEDPRRRVGTGPTAPLFVSSRHQRLSYSSARGALRRVCRAAEIAEPWPRPHDFRHTFAVSCVLAGYEQGADFDALLPALSTYLGHTCLEHTRLYLIDNGLLLEQAAQRFALQTSALDEVLP